MTQLGLYATGVATYRRYARSHPYRTARPMSGRQTGSACFGVAGANGRFMLRLRRLTVGIAVASMALVSGLVAAGGPTRVFACGGPFQVAAHNFTTAGVSGYVALWYNDCTTQTWAHMHVQGDGDQFEAMVVGNNTEVSYAYHTCNPSSCDFDTPANAVPNGSYYANGYDVNNPAIGGGTALYYLYYNMHG